ncbi:MAG: DUF6075 family protein [Clostridiales bacterium]|jgi:hypothetical protein|nr:DUF6075 family protein [Clostridiales bacterium]
MHDCFIDNSHKNRYSKLITVSGVHEYDSERQSLFYIISGNDDLFQKKKYIYDFYENFIIKDCLLPYNSIDFCSSSKSLIRLGFNLFNGYWEYFDSPLELFGLLDHKNLFIACNALLLRLRGNQRLLALSDYERS